MSVARRQETLTSEIIQNSGAPSAQLFESVRLMSGGAGQGRPGSAYSSAIAGGHWIEAVHLLVGEVFPETGFMAGLLPDGSAHARVMIRIEGAVRPVDAFRQEGDVSLTLLEAVARALEQFNPALRCQ